MKKTVAIPVCLILLLAASCGTVQNTRKNNSAGKPKRKSVDQIQFQANNNQTVLLAEGDTIERAKLRNRRKVEIEINGIDPETDSIVVDCRQADVFVGGDEPSNVLDSYETPEAIDAGSDKIGREKSNLAARKDVSDTDSLEAERVSALGTILLEKIRFWNMETAMLTRASKLDSLLRVMRRELFDFEKEISDYYSECETCLNNAWTEPAGYLRKLILTAEQRKLALTNQTRYYQFIPSKEQVDLEIKVLKRNSKVLKSTSGELTFSTIGCFKMTTGIGGHMMLIDGKYARTYENIDSVIVSGSGSNIRPSLGTYLNGTWNQGWGLMGFGLGVGLPLNIDGENDLTPNFSVFMTCQFQTDYGRMGFNLGMGICRVSQLKTGYYTGQNLGSASIDVPLTDVWRPGLMFGLNYVIGKQGNQDAE